MRCNFITKIGFPLCLLGQIAHPGTAQAMTLDWSGYLRANHDYVQNYQMNMASPGYSNNTAASGEYVPGEGQKSVAYSSVFMKLKPKVLVNDNVIIHSEWNIGDPVYGFFGQNIPNYDRNNPMSNSKDSVPIGVSRLWLDTHTDFGTLQVGRAPFHWGIGAIFNSGDGVMDRFQSTVDTIRLISKFGYISFMPFYSKNAMGRHLAGSGNNPLSPVDTVGQGSGNITDYGAALKYENPEEDIEGGVLFMKRGASDQQDSYYFPAGQTTYKTGANGMDLKLVDLYAKKTWTHFELKGELPFYSGTIGDINGAGQRNFYKVAALIGEAKLNYDTWKHSLKFGSVPGQGNEPTNLHDDNFGAMYLNRNYKLGMILFNYNFHGFGQANPNTVPSLTGPSGTLATITPNVVSPYDVSITNAKYLAWASEKHWEQWSVSGGLIYAVANHVATAGKDYYSHFTHAYGTAVTSQNKNMGWELDLGTSYNWDENISFGLEGGFFLPGQYFAFINIANQSQSVSMVKAFSLSVTTSF